MEDDKKEVVLKNTPNGCPSLGDLKFVEFGGLLENDKTYILITGTESGKVNVYVNNIEEAKMLLYVSGFVFKTVCRSNKKIKEEDLSKILKKIFEGILCY